MTEATSHSALAAAHALLALEIDQEGTTADQSQVSAALAQLREAVRPFDQPSTAGLSDIHTRAGAWRPF